MTLFVNLESEWVTNEAVFEKFCDRFNSNKELSEQWALRQLFLLDMCWFLDRYELSTGAFCKALDKIDLPEVVSFDLRSRSRSAGALLSANGPMRTTKREIHELELALKSAKKLNIRLAATAWRVFLLVSSAPQAQARRVRNGRQGSSPYVKRIGLRSTVIAKEIELVQDEMSRINLPEESDSSDLIPTVARMISDFKRRVVHSVATSKRNEGEKFDVDEWKREFEKSARVEPVPHPEIQNMQKTDNSCQPDHQQRETE